MALAYRTRRVTRDVAAVFEPKAAVYDAARRVAQPRGLDDDWLDDAVKGFLPGPDPDASAPSEADRSGPWVLLSDGRGQGTLWPEDGSRRPVAPRPRPPGG